MIASRIILQNWRNFRSVDAPLRQRQFIVGPNAAGKSNFLDAFRFLRDVAKSEGGGIQKAIKDRGGISKLRSLAARKDPAIAIEIHLQKNEDDENVVWRYRLELRQESRGFRQPFISKEKVWHGPSLILDRPNKDDENDAIRLTQTFLEQVNENASFREIVRFFESATYLHLVPQLLRFSESIQGRIVESDPFGQGLLERVAKANQRTQKSRLSRIETALKVAVPQLQQLRFERDDDSGRPHLSALYSHWRPKAGWQREDQFSDGTLRLIGLLWSLLESDSLLLLEEPELSLNSAIVARLAPIIQKMQKQRRRQAIISTHSTDLLSDIGIEGREILLLQPEAEGTVVTPVSQISDLSDLLAAGLPPGDVVLPRTAPKHMELLSDIV